MRSAHPKRRPRLLLVTRSLEVGGTERHLTQIAPRLAARGFDVSLYCLSLRGGQMVEVEGTDVRLCGPVPGASSGIAATVSLATGALGLVPEMLQQRPDIAHFFLPHAYLAGSLAALLTQVPVRIMSRRCLNHYQSKHPRLARLEHRLHASMSAILGNSQRVLGDLVGEGVQPGKAGLIYNGIDTARFSGPFDRAAARAKLGISSDATVLTIVANLARYKGHSDLLQGLAAVRDRLPTGWVLLAAGRDDGALASLHQEAEALGLSQHVRFLGLRRDVEDLLRVSDIGILASHEEGFSNALLEGMAAGLPMVATDVGGNAEAVIDGVCGAIVPARDPRRLGEAIARLASDPSLAARQGGAARERAERVFSLDAMIDSYEDVYRALLAGQPLPASVRRGAVVAGAPVLAPAEIAAAQLA